MDHVSKSVRSRIMASVHTKDTLPECRLRSMIHKKGYRYSLHRSDLPGKPDLVFSCRKKVIFVHGCFWHGHRCKYGRLPKSKIAYWESKITTNKERDKRQQKELKRLGWSVMIVWQCQLKNEEFLLQRVVEFLENE